MLLFMLIGVFLGQPVSATCPVEMSPTLAAVRYGDPFSANCSSLSDQTEGMGWESSLEGTPLTHGVTSIPLRIDAVTDWTVHAECYINLINGDQCSKILPITVYKIPDSVSVSQESPTGPLEFGQIYQMRCDIVNAAPTVNLSVNWYQGHKLIHTERLNQMTDATPGNRSSSIDLRAQKNVNGTQIWCEAELEFQPRVNLPTIRSEPHELIVLYPPFFTDPVNETLEIRAGSKVKLNCTATGNPSPGYSWDVPQSVRQTNKNQNKNGPILTLSFELPGTYKCMASNTLGTRTKYFTVTQAKRNFTTFAALVGGFVFLGVVLFVSGLFFMTPDGTFAFSKDGYLKGQPTSSGPV